MPSIKRALISVSDKSGIVEFSKHLKKHNIEILSTGGTAKALKEAGVDVIEISDYTKSPEILDGRLKTLHPKVHGGLLGIRDNSKHKEEMRANNIEPIDLVVVNLYPFEATIAKKDCGFEDAIENIDIGGPTMLRAAAKNHNDVAVVIDPKDYNAIADELNQNKGELSKQTCFRLAKKVFASTARYDAAICNYLNSIDDDRQQKKFPDKVAFTFEKAQGLRYGENPHQGAVFYKEHDVKEPCLANAIQLHGKELSYNNIMDADAVIEMVREFGNNENVAVIIKHANPCGIAVSSESLLDAFNKAKSCDPVSAFGGIIGLNRKICVDVANAIKETFFEVIVAPDYDQGALEILGKKKNLRLLKLEGLDKDHASFGWNFKKVVGGLLIQERDISPLSEEERKVVSKRKPTDDETKGLEFAWRVAKHVKSNAIVLTTKDQTIGIGAGQMSRVDSSKIAVMKSQFPTQGCFLASDAFFPFRDGVDAAAQAGVRAIIQPGGSVRDEEVIQAANEHDIAMLFTGRRHFRH